jgi:hypothetical protein
VSLDAREALVVSQSKWTRKLPSPLVRQPGPSSVSKGLIPITGQRTCGFLVCIYSCTLVLGGNIEPGAIRPLSSTILLQVPPSPVLSTASIASASSGSDHPIAGPSRMSATPRHLEVLAKRRVDSIQITAENHPPAKRLKRRTCGKCGREGKDCRGSGDRRLCNGQCRDCGSRSCYGRNTKHPEKNCTEGWVGVDGGKPSLNQVPGSGQRQLNFG